MPKILNLIMSFLVFAVGTVYFDSWYWFFSAGAGVVIFVIVLNLLRFKISRIQKNSFWRLVSPCLYLIGFFGTMAGVSNFIFKILLGVAGAGIFYFYQANFISPRLSEEDKEFFMLSAALLTMISIWSLHFYYTLPWWMVTLLALVMSILLFGEVFLGLTVPHAKVWTLVATLIIVETFSAVLYLPVNFFTQSVIVFSIFYLLYILSKLYFSKRLTAKRIYFHAALALVLVAGAAASSRWAL